MNFQQIDVKEKEIKKVKENQYKSFKRYSHLFTKHFDDDFNYWDMPYESAIYLDKKYSITTFLSFLFLKIDFFSTILLEPFELYSVTILFYITSLIIDLTFNALLLQMLKLLQMIEFVFLLLKENFLKMSMFIINYMVFQLVNLLLIIVYMMKDII